MGSHQERSTIIKISWISSRYTSANWLDADVNTLHDKRIDLNDP
jgi:hypothetical protein